jgi:four helix bundle protein
MREKGEYDIKDRTFKFGVCITRFINVLPKTTAGFVIAKQLVRSGTSIGANVEEATGGRTKREFANCIAIAGREARETSYWLRLIRETGMSNSGLVDTLLNEVNQLIGILTAISRRANENLQSPSP